MPIRTLRLDALTRVCLWCVLAFTGLPAAALAQPFGAVAADHPFTVDVKPVAAFGVAGGFPAYQTATGLASVQYRWGGLAVRAGYGTAGLQASVDVRAYPPVPVPVPIYAAAGVNLYAVRVAYHVAVGAHVPLTLRWRLDVEAGVAWVPFLFERSLAPHVLVGVSYAIPFDPDVVFSGPSDRRDRSSARADMELVTHCMQSGEPTPEGVEQGAARAVREFLVDAQAVYGSVYQDLQYDYSVEDVEISGSRAMLTVAYRGSVREIATGQRASASGDAVVALAWTGCGWTPVGVDY